MLFTEYISIDIKHVFIGVYNTQFHPSKSRGWGTQFWGRGMGQHTYTVGRGNWKGRPEG